MGGGDPILYRCGHKTGPWILDFRYSVAEGERGSIDDSTSCSRPFAGVAHSSAAEGRG